MENNSLEQLEKGLKTWGWEFSLLEDTLDTFVMLYLGQVDTITLYTKVDKEKGMLLCYGRTSFDIPESNRNQVNEFITRANFGMKIGNFELHLETGELRFKSSIRFNGVDLSHWLVNNCLEPCGQTLDKYCLGIKAIIEEGMASSQAIKLVEVDTVWE